VASTRVRFDIEIDRSIGIRQRVDIKKRETASLPLALFANQLPKNG
jgi:hypothetical protein